jgi:hypothetical protein
MGKDENRSFEILNSEKFCHSTSRSVNERACVRYQNKYGSCEVSYPAGVALGCALLKQSAIVVHLESVVGIQHTLSMIPTRPTVATTAS